MTDKNTNERTRLSLGESTRDQIFSAKSEIERTSSYGEPMKHKVTLQIKPQREEAANSNFDIKFIIKVRLFFIEICFETIVSVQC